MATQSSPAPPPLAAWFALIVDGLCAAVAARAPRHVAGPLLVMVYGRLRRLVARFARLVEQAAAVTLPTRRVRGVRARPAGREGARWPRGFAWLVQMVPEAAVFGSQLRHLLLQPEMAALIAATRQAGRMVGPLGHMLAVQIAPSLPRPARSRARPADAPTLQALPVVAPHDVSPGMMVVESGAFAGKVIPAWARYHWPGHDYAGRDPPGRGTPARGTPAGGPPAGGLPGEERSDGVG